MDKIGLYNYLCSLPNVVKKDDWWCCTRCVLCGDSKKNPYKKRLYINCDPTKPDAPVWYKCFNCNSCSVLTKEMLDMIADGATMDAVQGLRQANKAAFNSEGSAKVNRYYNQKEIDVVFPGLRNREYLIDKYRYLCKGRLGIIIPPEDFQKLKIVWSLKDFIEENHLTLQESDVDTRILERDYVGFASVKNEYIIFRDITGRNKYRWFKYNTFGMHGNISSYYAIKNGINLFSQNDIHIIVAEGTIDVLGILYHIYDGEQGNNVFLATRNGSFEEPIRYYLSKGLIGSNIHIDCYIDNDTRYNFKAMRDRLAPFVMSKKNIHIFHNVKRKDFGYSKDQIQREELLL